MASSTGRLRTLEIDIPLESPPAQTRIDTNKMPAIPNRWDALDVFRGLTIMLMLLNLNPGSWEFNYPWLVHAVWEGWTLIDMVAPAFLFFIGAALPLSFTRRVAKGATQSELLKHVVSRGLILVALGFFLNLYPKFDFATVRIPSVLSRIGLCYLLAGSFIVLTSRFKDGAITLRPALIAGAAAAILVSYWALLYFVPVPGFGPQRFDPVGSWPAVIDRAVLGVEHLFPWWPVDGKVVFDPEGILSTVPACFNILLGALVGIAYSRNQFKQPVLAAVGVGLAMILAAYALTGICLMVKNIWTSTFALFSGGFCVVLLGLLMPVSERPGIRPVFAPARIFGENPLLAYVLSFLIAPFIDGQVFGSTEAPQSLREVGQAFFSQFLAPNAASLAFGLCGLLAIFIVLLVCHRKRWILKL
jgi:predicted acyltransferase